MNQKIYQFMAAAVLIVIPTMSSAYSESLTNMCTDLQAYWKFDGQSSSLAADSTGSGHTLLFGYEPSFTSSAPSEISFANTGSIMFDGTDDYLYASLHSSLQLSGSITLSAWVDVSTVSQTGIDANVILANGGTSEMSYDNLQYYFNIRPDSSLQLRWESDSGDETRVQSSTTTVFSSGTWKHLAVVRNHISKSVTFYVDGSIFGDVQSYLTNATDGTSAITYIGTDPEDTVGDHNFSGNIDDVRIYTKLLTGSQISTLYATSDVYLSCTCGNSIVESPETCDTGDSNSNSTADACRTNCRVAYCGDSVVDTGEQCDDGNAVNTDACTSSCLNASCGDGYTQAGEECDNGDNNSDETADACRLTCVAASCGDGVIDTGETCDDGNNVNTDACSNTCSTATCGDGVVQAGEACDNGSSNSDATADACRTSCTAARCGDGVVDTGEACDDGNSVNTDACSNTCVAATCGDGIVQSSEECDNGDSNSDSEVDGCRTSCLSAYCGDGVVDTGETCDDSGESASCTASCTTSSCGDGITNTTAGETCDNGVDNSNTVVDACRLNCVVASCGDGIVDTGEGCDDQNTVNTDACTNSCTVARCGDGFVQSSNNEVCEPPGTSSCASNCTVTTGGGKSHSRKRNQQDENRYQEKVFTKRAAAPKGCGNRITEENLGEECDEGDQNGKGACSYECKILWCGDGVVSASMGEQCEPEVLETIAGVKIFKQLSCEIGADCQPPTYDPKSQLYRGGCKRVFLSECTQSIQQDEEVHQAADKSEGIDIVLPVCGNGIIDNGEECDIGGICLGGTMNGNHWLTNADVVSCVGSGGSPRPESGDGCSATCRLEICGNGITEVNGADGIPNTADDEQCDGGDGCTSQCTLSSCGNGIIEPGEHCDDGDRIDNDGCSSRCRYEICGDGFVSLAEECDDGNTIDGDGCSKQCKSEKMPTLPKTLPTLPDSILRVTHQPVVQQELYRSSVSSVMVPRTQASSALSLSLIQKHQEVEIRVLLRNSSSSAASSVPLLVVPTKVLSSSVASFRSLHSSSTKEKSVESFTKPQYTYPKSVEQLAVKPNYTYYVPQQYYTPQYSLHKSPLPIPETGPGSIVFIISGAAAGFSFVRRKRS